MWPILIGASWILILATVLPFIKHEAWWIRVFDFPRSQFTVVGMFTLLGLIALWHPATVHWGTTALLAACIAYQSWELSAYTRLRAPQSLAFESDDVNRRVRLLIANVLMENRDVAQYISLIERYSPDIIVLAEPDMRWEQELKQIEAAYPFTMKCPLDNTYGLLLYSRLTLSEPRTLFRVEEGVPSFACMVELPSSDRFELHAVHPRPPHVGVDTENRDAELVLVAREVKDSKNAVVVTGDLNDVAWSHTTRLFLRLSKLLDPRVGRTFCNTFHAKYWLFRWPLDHLFHSRAFRLVGLKRLERTASDHFPVLVELSYEPEVKHEQERPVADADDHEEAQDKVERARDSESG